MVDITQKKVTLRTAIAEARIVLSQKETLRAIEQDQVPKGNVFEMSKAAGLLGVKKTPDLLPDCHPIPIEATTVSYAIEGLEISISVMVKIILSRVIVMTVLKKYATNLIGKMIL